MTIIAERPTLLTEPGVYPDVDESDYHRDPVEGGSLSSTGARTLARRTPAHFEYERRHGRKPKREFDLGSAFHTLLLGRGAEIVHIDADNYNRKVHQQERDAAYDERLTPVLSRQLEDVKAMVAAVLRHEYAGKLFARPGRPEVTAVGRDPETGIMCRARFDWLIDSEPGMPVTFIDVKSTTDASPLARAKSMSNFGYHAQAPFYEDTLTWALDLDVPVAGVLLFVEREPPHLLGFGEPDEQAIAWGRQDNRRARHLFRRCTAAGVWPGYDPNPVPLSLPGFQLRAYEDADDAGAYTFPTREETP